ncbi:hypothetical protein OIU76_011518 [Salix suchowensis]|uniref:Amino acid transporter transmembrane domain-containing protein n=1 Tax=Salix suchowensis TaxID=1278906 RepID=A0ABQ8ZWY1_9ROSI|nr:hypothetical protein OIU77_014345 [Salix suchowensis]KAJ6324229.1 hypothetical protein OIU76_011518 [Salix suchowensis]
MITGNIASKKERKSRRNKPVDEDAPLLPKRQEDVGFDEFNGASFTGAVFNLSTTIVGAGIMALPAIMKVLGLVLGVALIIFMAFLTEASIEMLLRFSRVGKSASYEGLMGDAFGKTGRIMLQVAVLINKIGHKTPTHHQNGVIKGGEIYEDQLVYSLKENHLAAPPFAYEPVV